MTPTLLDELQQTKPFTSLEQEAQLSIVRTGTMLVDQMERLLRPYGISSTQYNVLRILRGAEPHGLCRNELRERLLTRMPDVTRLLDRMEEAGLVVRTRDTTDRRLVTTHNTERGHRLVGELDSVVDDEHRRRLGHLTPDQLRAMIGLLTTVRERI